LSLPRHNVLVLGGSGFIGRHIVAQLAAANHRITVVTRRRAAARHLILLPTVDVVEADPYNLATLTQLARGMTAAINLVGIINEMGSETFARAHVELPRTLIAACERAGVPRLLHMSALHAARSGPSRYLRSKADGEALVTQSPLAWTTFRPSVIFGREDHFLNLFAKLARIRVLPVIPLGASDAKFQPVFVGDVARCFVGALNDDATVRQGYDLCGPKVYTLRELVRYVAETTGAPKPIIPLGPGLAKLQALTLEMLPGKLLSRDNLASMQQDSVCEGPFPAVFGITPTELEAVAPGYLTPDSEHSRYDEYRTHGGR
jgi:uncharacterized protein YbjT (DUF2867 family)